MIIYAIGDVHGCDNLLKIMHERIVSDHRASHADGDAVILHVGDYIDRGPDSLAVIDRLMRGVEGFDTISLKGNHEAMMLACAESDDPRDWSLWLANGGAATLASLGLGSGDRNCAALVEALGVERLNWLHSLPLFHQTSDTLFVHAGIRPGRPIAMQSEQDLLWIRAGFLESWEDHGFLVVHGHTPVDLPEIMPNRLGIDTGAVFTGLLSAAVIGETQGLRFLAAGTDVV